MARKRRTKAEILEQESQGLGDTVEKVLEVTGVAKVAKIIGCSLEEASKFVYEYDNRFPNQGCLIRDLV